VSFFNTNCICSTCDTHPPTHSVATHGDKTTAGDIATVPRRNKLIRTKKLNYRIQVHSSTANALAFRYVVDAQFLGGGGGGMVEKQPKIKK
jgi:hypothetical protein